MTVLFSSIRHLQSNPVERTMREIRRIFRTYCSKQHTKWAKYVTFVQDCLNFTTHQSNGCTPHYLHYGSVPNDKILTLFPKLCETSASREVQLRFANDNLQKAYKTRCKAQKAISRVMLDLGDIVLLHVPHLSDASQRQIGKFFHIYEGPYVISKRVGENAFHLVFPDNESKAKGI